MSNPYDEGVELQPQDSFQREPSIIRNPRSIRSAWSRRSNETSNQHREPSNPYVPRPSTNTARSARDDQQSTEEYDDVNEKDEDEGKLLPTVLEAEEDDEEMPEISDVMEEFEESKYEPGSNRRRGHSALAGRRREKRKNRTKMDPNSRLARFIKGGRHIWVNILSQNLYTRMFIYWFPLALILFIPLAIGAWAKHDATLGKTRLQWIFIWLEIVWGSMWLSRIVAHLLAPVFETLVGILSPPWRKYGAVIRALETAISLVLWALVSMITFMPIMTQNPHASPKTEAGTQPWQRVVNNIMVALLVSSLVYTAERLLIYFLSVSFHRTRFAHRIKDNKLQIRVLGQMLQASYLVFPPFSPEFEAEDLEIESGALLNKGRNMQIGIARKIAQSQNVQKAVGTLNRFVGGAATAIQNVGRDLKGNRGGHTSVHNTVIDALASKALSEVLGRRIWLSLVLEGAEELAVDDLVEVLGEEQKADATTVFDVLDQDGNGALTLEEMIQACKDIGKERKTIYRSLRDVDSAIAKLHSLLLFVVVIIVIVIFVGMLAPSVSAVLATLGTSLLALSFVFSVTAQEVLAACVFLFVKHPLDVGDLVEISHPKGVQQFVVQEISLMHTVLKFNGTGEITQASNAVLNTLFIDNITRSDAMSTPFTLTLGIPETSYEDLEELKDRVDQFLENNSRDYYPNPYFQVTDFPDLDRITLTISIQFRSNNQDGTLYGMRRTRVYQFLAQCVHDIPLHVPRRTENYTDPTVPMVVANPDQLPWAKNSDDSNPFTEDVPHARNAMGMRPRVPQEPTPEPSPAPVDHAEAGGAVPVPAGSGEVRRHLTVDAMASGSNFNRSNSVMSRTSSAMTRTRTTGRRRRSISSNAPQPDYDQDNDS